MDTILSFLNHLEFENRYSKRTITSYKTDILQFRTFCRNNSVNDIQHVDSKLVREWIIFLIEKGCENRSVNRKISALKSFYKYLIRQGTIQKSPLIKIDSLKAKKRLPGFITDNQINVLFNDVEFESDFAGVRNRLILEIFYQTGIRLSELINIRDTDIDRFNLTLKVYGKRKKERLIPIDKGLLTEIDNYFDYRKRTIDRLKYNFLLVTVKGLKLYPKLVYRLVNKYLSMVTTLDKRSPHVWRHTFATLMLNNGAAIGAIKELLGHSNLAATQIYTHNSFEKLKKVYNQAHPRA